MRDRSRARNFSASRDEFRRDHERRRMFGLQRRHAERMRQVREREAGCFPADLQVPWATVDDDRPGITGPPPPRVTRPPAVVQQPPPRVTRPPKVVQQPPPRATRPPKVVQQPPPHATQPPKVVQQPPPHATQPSTVVQQPAPDRDLRADRGSQTGSTKRPGPSQRPEPTGEVHQQQPRTPSTPSGPTRPKRGCRATAAPGGRAERSTRVRLPRQHRGDDPAAAERHRPIRRQAPAAGSGDVAERAGPGDRHLRSGELRGRRPSRAQRATERRSGHARSPPRRGGAAGHRGQDPARSREAAKPRSREAAKPREAARS